MATSVATRQLSSGQAETVFKGSMAQMPWIESILVEWVGTQEGEKFKVTVSVKEYRLPFELMLACGDVLATDRKTALNEQPLGENSNQFVSVVAFATGPESIVLCGAIVLRRQGRPVEVVRGLFAIPIQLQDGGWKGGNAMAAHCWAGTQMVNAISEFMCSKGPKAAWVSDDSTAEHAFKLLRDYAATPV